MAARPATRRLPTRWIPRGYSLGLTQILTRDLISSLNLEVITDEGISTACIVRCAMPRPATRADSPSSKRSIRERTPARLPRFA